MPNKYKIRESNHERAILHRDELRGYQGTRTPASLGLIDVITWNENEINFYASKSIGWNRKKQEEIWIALKRPPNSHLYFIGRDDFGVEYKEDGDELAEKFGWVK